MENGKNYGVISLIACGLAIFWSGFVCFGFPGVMGMEWQERFHVGPSETGLVVTFMLLALAVAMFFFWENTYDAWHENVYINQYGDLYCSFRSFIYGQKYLYGLRMGFWV